MTDGLNLRLLDVLSTMADELVTELAADACAISRMIGDVLILVAECVPDGSTLLQGQGYLVPDYPQTAEVLRTRMPRALTLTDADIDDAEARVLRDHGYASLAMLPLELKGGVWGLVELYRHEPRPFTEAELRRALELTRVS